MCVVRDAAAGRNPCALLSVPVGRRANESSGVIVVEMRLLAAVAAPRDVLRQTRNYQPCKSRRANVR